VGELQLIVLASGAQPGIGHLEPLAVPRGRQRAAGQLMGAAVALQHPLRLHVDGQIAGCSLGVVGAPDQHRRAAPAVSCVVDRQLRGDDQRHTRAHRVAGGVADDRQVFTGQQPQIQRSGDAGQPVEHLVDELPAGETLGLKLAADAHPGHTAAHRRRDRGIEMVLHLHRATDRCVGIEQNRIVRQAHFTQPRCMATMPPVRFFHWTSRQPTSVISSARLRWSGQARIDSTR